MIWLWKPHMFLLLRLLLLAPLSRFSRPPSASARHHQTTNGVWRYFPFDRPPKKRKDPQPAIASCTLLYTQLNSQEPFVSLQSLVVRAGRAEFRIILSLRVSVRVCVLPLVVFTFVRKSIDSNWSNFLPILYRTLFASSPLVCWSFRCWSIVSVFNSSPSISGASVRHDCIIGFCWNSRWKLGDSDAVDIIELCKDLMSFCLAGFHFGELVAL